MKEMLKKISDKLRLVFGYGIMITLFVGGLTFLGYLAALLIGGNLAAQICRVIYKQIIPVMIYISTITVLLGLLVMYLAGETALTTTRNKNVDKKRG